MPGALGVTLLGILGIGLWNRGSFRRIEDNDVEPSRVAFFVVYVVAPRESKMVMIPSGYVKIAIENHHRNSGFTH